MVSLLTGRTVKPNVGMTGEITLRGKVLPIGGVKEKVLAARRAGLDTVILPYRNEKDLDDVPEKIRKEMTFVFAEYVDDVLNSALNPAPVRPSANGHAAGDGATLPVDPLGMPPEHEWREPVQA